MCRHEDVAGLGLLAAGKFTDSEIANFAMVTEDFVRKVRADLSKKKK